MRVVIFQRLARTPATAGELASELPITRAAVVQHLKRLLPSSQQIEARAEDALTESERALHSPINKTANLQIHLNTRAMTKSTPPSVLNAQTLVPIEVTFDFP